MSLPSGVGIWVGNFLASVCLCLKVKFGAVLTEIMCTVCQLILWVRSGERLTVTCPSAENISAFCKKNMQFGTLKQCK